MKSRTLPMLMTLALMPTSALAEGSDKPFQVANEDQLREECPHRAYDPESRSCQVRTLLAELRSLLSEKNYLEKRIEDHVAAERDDWCERLHLLTRVRDLEFQLAVKDGQADAAEKALSGKLRFEQTMEAECE